MKTGIARTERGRKLKVDSVSVNCAWLSTSVENSRRMNLYPLGTHTGSWRSRAVQSLMGFSKSLTGSWKSVRFEV